MAMNTKEARALMDRFRALSRTLEEACNTADRYGQTASEQMESLLKEGVFAGDVRRALKENRASPEPDERAFELIASLTAQRACGEIARQSQQLLLLSRDGVARAISQLSPAGNGLRYFFTSGKTKEQAAKAQAYLQKLLEGGYAQAVEKADREVRGAAGRSREEMLSDFSAHLGEYRGQILTLCPKLQAPTTPLPEAARVLSLHANLSDRLTGAQAVQRQLEAEAKSAVERVMAGKVQKILADIPVEDMARDNKGLHVKTLTDAGYRTMAEVRDADLCALSAVKGISDTGAAQLKQYAEECAARARAAAKIRLSADERTPESTRLIRALCAYRRRIGTLSALSKLQAQYDQPVKRDVRTLSSLGGGDLWLFMSPQDQERIAHAYNSLSSLLTGEYGTQASLLLSALDTPLSFTDEEAWADFIADPIAYTQLIEELTPGVLGTEDVKYGLPEELAKSIQKVPLLTEGLKCGLRRYQEWGVKYILHQEHSLLGDEMGLGKTVQAIAAMVCLRNTGATHFLVVCPASVMPNWLKEIGGKSDIRPTKIHGPARAQALATWLEQGGAAVTTYEGAANIHLPEDFRIDLAVVDEAHYIKNPEALRTIHVKRLCRHARRTLFMTGTPLENKVDEMLSLVGALQPDTAKGLEGIAFMSAAPQFRQQAAPVYYRRRREDVLTELPELIESQEWCTLGQEEQEAYRQSVLSRNFAAVRQVSFNIEDMDNSCKARRMKEIVEEAAEDGRKVIVFSFFLKTLRKVKEYLGGRCLGPINGSVPPARRQQIIDEFERAPAGSVLVSQIQSGGTGLNIQAASVVILCEPQFKPSIENQAISRAYRMGQARNVLVYRLLCEDTADEKLTALLSQKQAIFDAFADESDVADAVAKQDVELDEQTFGSIVEEEAKRLEAEGSGHS